MEPQMHADERRFQSASDLRSSASICGLLNLTKPDKRRRRARKYEKRTHLIFARNRKPPLKLQRFHARTRSAHESHFQVLARRNVPESAQMCRRAPECAIETVAVEN